MPDLTPLIDRVRAAEGADRELDEEIAEALGGKIRRVTGLGLNGRTPGSWRVFWPGDTSTRGNRIPYYTRDEKSRARTIAKLALTGGHDG